MTTIHIDLETFSDVPISKGGVYKYAESVNFEILLFGYSLDDGKVELIDLTKDPMPWQVIELLKNKNVLKKSFNANFERIAIRYGLGIDIPADEWECTMVKSAMVGLPLSLDQVAKVLKLPQEKMSTGKQLIRYFCMPCRPTIKNKGRTRNYPHHDPDKWEEFKRYCIQDIVVETAIDKKLNHFDIMQRERRLWILDQKINDRGVLVDPDLIREAIKMDTVYTGRLIQESSKITGLSNPNSISQLSKWLSNQTGIEVTLMDKETISGMLTTDLTPVVKKVLENRQELSKSSVKKYLSMTKSIGYDNRIRGLLQFYGANRTGRAAGRLVQMQNLPQNHLKDIALARQLVKAGDLADVELLFGNVPDTLSQLIRTAFIAPAGRKLTVVDFSAIEPRISSWLSGEKWRIDVFNSHGKLYEANAAQMFKVPVEEVTKGSPWRQKSKISELACSYGGGVNALLAMGALKMNLTEEELPGLVSAWRKANPKIVKMWGDMNQAAHDAILEPGSFHSLAKGIKFFVNRNILHMQLPNGRMLRYIRPRIGVNRFGNSSILYEGMNQFTKKWMDLDTYGSKLFENAVQAIARDCLMEALLRIDAQPDMDCVMHVHDELIIETPDDKEYLKEIIQIITEPILWAKGLTLAAEGMECSYYQK